MYQRLTDTKKISWKKKVLPLLACKRPLNTLSNLVSQQNSPKSSLLSSTLNQNILPDDFSTPRSYKFTKKPKTNKNQNDSKVSDPLPSMPKMNGPIKVNHVLNERYPIKQVHCNNNSSQKLHASDLIGSSVGYININNYSKQQTERRFKNTFNWENNQWLPIDHSPKTLASLLPSVSIPLKQVLSSLLKAISKLHSREIIHTSICPSNILSTDLNTLEFKDVENSKGVFNIYTAPELMLGCPYNKAVDMWSFGCIMAEMIIGEPLFRGDNSQDLLSSIMKVLGRPPYNLLRLGSKTSNFFRYDQGIFYPISQQRFPYNSSLRKIEALYTYSNALELLELCLNLNPVCRVTAQEALNHPFFVTCSSLPELPRPDKARRTLTKSKTMPSNN